MCSLYTFLGLILLWDWFSWLFSICIFWIVILYQLHTKILSCYAGFFLTWLFPVLCGRDPVRHLFLSKLNPIQKVLSCECVSCRVLPLFSSSCQVLRWSFFTHLELLLCRVVETDLVSFFHLWTSVSHHPLLKMFSLLLLQCVFLESCQILGSYKYVVLWLGFICLLLHWSTCLFVCCAMLFSVLWLCDIICTWLLGVDCTISSCHSSACYSSFAPDCWVNESTQTLRYSQW